MLQRESLVSPGEALEGSRRPKHVLFHSFALPGNKEIHVNSLTGQVCRELPPMVPGPGGILADDTGLGKETVIVALAAYTKEFQQGGSVATASGVSPGWERESLGRRAGEISQQFGTPSPLEPARGGGITGADYLLPKKFPGRLL